MDTVSNFHVPFETIESKFVSDEKWLESDNKDDEVQVGLAGTSSSSSSSSSSIVSAPSDPPGMLEHRNAIPNVAKVEVVYHGRACPCLFSCRYTTRITPFSYIPCEIFGYTCALWSSSACRVRSVVSDENVSDLRSFLPLPPAGEAAHCFPDFAAYFLEEFRGRISDVNTGVCFAFIIQCAALFFGVLSSIIEFVILKGVADCVNFKVTMDSLGSRSNSHNPILPVPAEPFSFDFNLSSCNLTQYGTHDTVEIQMTTLAWFWFGMVFVSIFYGFGIFIRCGSIDNIVKRPMKGVFGTVQLPANAQSMQVQQLNQSVGVSILEPVNVTEIQKWHYRVQFVRGGRWEPNLLAIVQFGWTACGTALCTCSEVDPNPPPEEFPD